MLSKICGFLINNAAWWLAPAVIIAVLTGLLIFLGRSSQSVPFVYISF